MDDFPDERYYLIEVDRIPPFEQFARLFSIIAYPDFKDKSERDAFCDALTIWAIEKTIGQRQLNDHYSIQPRILLQDQKERLKILNRGINILQEARMLGLHIGEDRFNNFDTAISSNEVAIDIPHLTEEKVKETYELWCRRRDVVVTPDKGNLHNRWWKPAARVFHLLIAMRPYLRAEEAGGFSLALETFAEGTNIKAILKEAAESRDYIRALFSMDRDMPVRVDWER